MEALFFLYENYPWIIAGYGYYRTYKSINNGITVYNTVINLKNWAFPPRIKNNWIHIEGEVKESTQIIDLDKHTILIERNEGDWEIIENIKQMLNNDLHRKGSFHPSHKNHTFDSRPD